MHRALVLSLSLVGFAPAGFARTDADTGERVDFARDVMPILRDRCHECHGAEVAKGRLRLDRRADAFAEKPGGFAAIVPGNAEESLLYELVTLDADDPDIMPAEGSPLSAEQIELLRRWIEQGADWPESADVPTRPEHEDGMEPRALDDAQVATEASAIAAIAGRGGIALRVAQNTNVVDVNLSLLGAEVTDADLLLLRGLEPTLVWLNVARTAISDAGCATLAQFPEIRRLNLSSTAIGDDGLAALAALAHVEYLNLYGTQVTDRGIAHLAALKKLKKLYLWRTPVTEAGAALLAAALPDALIDRGDYVLAEPVTDAPVAADLPCNETCPLTGAALAAEHFVMHEGVRIGFCCANCKATFAQDPAAHLDKVGGFAAARAKLGATVPVAEPAPAKTPTNTTCPVTGAAVNPAFTSEVDGVVVGFCCGNCKKKFDADPKAFPAKVPEEKR